MTVRDMFQVGDGYKGREEAVFIWVPARDSKEVTIFRFLFFVILYAIFLRTLSSSFINNNVRFEEESPIGVSNDGCTNNMDDAD